MSKLSTALIVGTTLALTLACGCGSAAKAPKTGPYGNVYVKGFPLEPNGRPIDTDRDLADRDRDKDFDREREMDELQRQQREDELERQQQQQEERDLGRVTDPGDHCSSCP